MNIFNRMINCLRRYQTVYLLIFSLSFVLVFPSCRDEEPESQTTLTDAFESGSIGSEKKTGTNTYDLYIADDNDDTTLAESWRCWWYVRLEQADTGSPTTLTIKNSGWSYYYIPVFSYDQKQWFHFAEEEVISSGDNEIRICKQFDHETVWVARFYPYTLTDLETWLNTVRGQLFADISIPGYSRNGKPIYLLKLTDPAVPVSAKKRIFMHARTHPAETAPSFLIEGLVGLLLSGSAEALDLLARFEFYIFPMQNVDGVIAGNYRTTTQSENLEVMWYRDSLNPEGLTSETPPEVTTLWQVAHRMMTDGGPGVTVALNLHGSNSEPDICPFFYPHFGPVAKGYSSSETALWDKQLAFIGWTGYYYGADRLEPVPDQGGSSFATKMYPESWWWNNYGDRVMAMTLELTYGRAGYAPRWVEPDDYRNLGRALALGLRDYSDGLTLPVMCKSSLLYYLRRAGLTDPDHYPPDAPDELKE